ncbi:MAG: hypothetical protein KatS3mg104_1792 [Phycisphaerae bacterium]|jgi:hypothetical protein|nr:MAG: hypothetical protein KatS3mg104_1792 [Phycisphaerae bacterium]
MRPRLRGRPRSGELRYHSLLPLRAPASPVRSRPALRAASIDVRPRRLRPRSRWRTERAGRCPRHHSLPLGTAEAYLLALAVRSGPRRRTHTHKPSRVEPAAIAAATRRFRGHARDNRQRTCCRNEHRSLTLPPPGANSTPVWVTHLNGWTRDSASGGGRVVARCGDHNPSLSIPLSAVLESKDAIVDGV